MQVLDYDSSTYQTFHRMTLEWPCLSFDLVRDGLGEQRDRFPLTAYAVAGTQADPSQPAAQNSLLVLKMSQLNKTQHDSDDEADSDSDEDDGDAVLEHRAVQHHGAVNRVKCQTQCPNIVASWAETGSVHVFDVAKQLAVLDGPLPVGEQLPSASAPPLQSFDGAPLRESHRSRSRLSPVTGWRLMQVTRWKASHLIGLTLRRVVWPVAIVPGR
jgi:ribosome assembly protein RRB1